ncbi:MAG TPA: hypothetical protein VIY47_01245 [Ignavibacteriaceae bacterium]
MFSAVGLWLFLLLFLPISVVIIDGLSVLIFIIFVDVVVDLFLAVGAEVMLLLFEDFA